MNPFFTIVFLVYTLINSYIFYRGWQALPPTVPVKVIYCVLFFIVFCSFFVAMGGRGSLPTGVLKPIYFVGTTWLGVMLYMTLFLLLTDLVHLLNHFFHFLPGGMTPTLFHRVQMLSGYLIVFLVLGIGNYKFKHPAVVEKDITIHKDGGEIRDLRVVAFSDLHLGMGIGKKQLKNYVELINAQNPDIILIPGDLIDNSVAPLEKEKMHEELNQLKAPLGVYLAPGNHEFISGIAPSLEFLNKTQVKVLMDSAVLVNDSFWIIGRDDKSNAKRMPLSQLTRQTNPDQPIFLLDHQPYHLEEAEANGIDLQLSGHTHAGQLWPFSLIVDKMYEVGHGYKQKGDTHIYVSSGLALWGPEFRVGTQSEIVVFNIHFR